jgi:hypothetical protein
MNRAKRSSRPLKTNRPIWSPLATREAEAERIAAQRLEMLKLEHQTSRRELLWRLNGIYDVQKAAIPLIVGLMVALTWAGAKEEAKNYPKLALVAAWLLIPLFSILTRMKMKHHRQRNEELSIYHKIIERVIFRKPPLHNVEGDHGSSIYAIRIAKKRGAREEVVTIGAEDLGWEHFIRKYRYVLPTIVGEIRKIDDKEAEGLKGDHKPPKPIASMSKIDMRFMNVFVACAVVISLVQVYFISQDWEIWSQVHNILDHVVQSVRSARFWRLGG